MSIQTIGNTTAVDYTTLQKTQANKAAASTPPAGGAPPAGGSKPASSTSSTSSTSGTSSSLAYDPRDTNQDGIISAEEMLKYAIAHPEKDTQSQTAAPTAQKQAGLNAYQNNAQIYQGPQGDNSTNDPVLVSA